MPQFSKLTPNLLVASVERSVDFYTRVLGFEKGLSVPDDGPLVFASVTSGPVEIFFNDVNVAVKEYPALAKAPIGASGTMFIELEGAGAIDALHERLKAEVAIAMPIQTQWYGMREFAIADPDGYLITFAERVQV